MHRLLHWIPDISQATFIDIQNVSDYFWSNEREYWDLTDFNLAPPFPFFATRYTIPQEIYSKEFGVNPLGALLPKTEILTVFRQVEGLPNYWSAPDLPIGKRANTDERKTIPGARWYYDIFLFPVIEKMVEPPAYFMMAIDERGQIVNQPGREVKAFFTAKIYNKFNVQELPLAYLHVSGLALSFLHSRNVQILPPEPAPQKRRQPRNRPFISQYHRLKVNALGQRREREGSDQPTGIGQSLHIVRGHFRYYGRAAVNGNPQGIDTGLLFGKHEGAFWIASHASGSAGLGVVTKDYEINPPTDKRTSGGQS